RGASNFLSKSTKWLAIAFFVISMGMAVYASKVANGGIEPKADLGVMAQQPAPAPAPAPAQPVAQVPTAAAQPAATPAEAAPAAPAPAQPAPAQPAPAQGD